MHSRRVGMGHSPHHQISDRPCVAPVLYSLAIRHLGLFRTRTTESSGSRGLDLTVWITRARQGWGVRTAPCPSCAGMPTSGDASRRGGPSARSRGTGDSARFCDARATAQAKASTGSLRAHLGVDRVSLSCRHRRHLKKRRMAGWVPVPDGGFRNG